MEEAGGRDQGKGKENCKNKMRMTSSETTHWEPGRIKEDSSKEKKPSPQNQRGD